MTFDTGTVGDDLYCVSCGYNLRTLNLGGRCPECGEPVALTLRTHQQVIDPRRLRSRGWLFFVAALLAGLLWVKFMGPSPNYAY